MAEPSQTLIQHWKWIGGDGIALLAGIWTVTMGLVANNNAQKAAILDVRNDKNLDKEAKESKERELNSLFDRIHDFNLKYAMPILMLVILAILPLTNDGIKKECEGVGYLIWYSVSIIFCALILAFMCFLVKRTKTRSGSRIKILSSALVLSILALFIPVQLPFLKTPGQHFIIKIGLISITDILGYLFFLMIKRLKPLYDRYKNFTYWVSPIFNCFIYGTLLYGIAVFAFREIKYFDLVS